MIEHSTPRGLPPQVPEVLSEDPSPRFGTHELRHIKDCYDQNGYVIVTGIFDAKTCDAQRKLWEKVKPFRGHNLPPCEGESRKAPSQREKSDE